MSDQDKVRAVLDRARANLATTRHGLNDYLSSPDADRRLSGLQNVIVWGRTVSWVIQNLRSIVGDQHFNGWYRPLQDGMRSSQSLRYLLALRNQMEKKGVIDPRRYRIAIEFGSPDDPATLEAMASMLATNEPIGPDLAKSFVPRVLTREFFGEPNAETGEPPPDREIPDVLKAYVEFLERLVREAQREFAPDLTASSSSNESLFDALAGESDDEFIERTEALSMKLPERWSAAVSDELHSLPLNAPSAIPHLVFIPVAYLVDDPATDKQIGREVFELLEGLEGVRLIACGESTADPLAPESAEAASLDTFVRVLQLRGYDPVDRTKLRRRKDAPASPFGYLDALFRFAASHPEVRLSGVDTMNGAALVSVIDSQRLFLTDRPGWILELSFRLNIEFRTRYALHRASELAGRREIAFVQGLFHQPGVEAWAHRHGVALSVRRPKIMINADYQRGIAPQ